MNILLTATPEQLENYWCVYKLYHHESAKLLYIGHCELARLFYLPGVDLPKNEPFIIEVRNLYMNKGMAKKAVIEEININGTPPINQKMPPRRQNGPIECIDTGQKFANMSDCIKTHGLTQSALSNHLNGKPGHKTVKGRTYRRTAP